MANNNPGNIVDSPWTRQQPGYAGAHGRFATFDTPESGQAAMASLLGNYYASGHTTLSSIISKWAPQTENPTPNYINYVAQRTGIDPTKPVSADQLPLVAGAMTEFEQGTRPKAAVAQYDASGQPIAATPPASSAAAPSQKAQPVAPAPAVASGDDALLEKYLGGGGSAPTPSPGEAGSADDALLEKYLGGTDAVGQQNPPTVGDRAAELAAAQSKAEASPPQISPTLNAYANGVAEGIPVLGPLVNNAIDFVGSHIASAITGRPVDEELARGRQRYENSSQPKRRAAGIG